MTVLARRAAHRRHRRCCARRGSSACRTPTTADRSATACSPRRRARSSCSATRLGGIGPARTARRSRRATESPAGDRQLAATFPVRAADPQAAHAVPELQLLAAAQARPARGRPVRRADRRRRRARWAWPTVELAEVCNDRATVRLPVKITERLPPGVVAIPLGWWSSQHDDGKVANSLTNDTLHRLGWRRRVQRHARRRSRAAG